MSPQITNAHSDSVDDVIISYVTNEGAIRSDHLVQRVVDWHSWKWYDRYTRSDYYDAIERLVEDGQIKYEPRVYSWRPEDPFLVLVPVEVAS